MPDIDFGKWELGLKVVYYGPSLATHPDELWSVLKLLGARLSTRFEEQVARRTTVREGKSRLKDLFTTRRPARSPRSGEQAHNYKKTREITAKR
ncbi:hypothetical protein ACFL59_05060 [Planctomycetota bacterium]